MKTIDTLVEDIYGLFSSEEPDIFSEGSVATFADKLGTKIRERVNEERGPNKLRLSNIGKPCQRQLYYDINSPEKGEPLPPEVRLKFLYGDILEEMLLWLAAEAGHRVEGEQDELDVYGVKGHRDAVIDGVTVDVKSASSYSFNKFNEGLKPDQDAFGYLPQLDAYIEGGHNDPLVEDKDRGAFLVIDKTLGKITLDIHKRKDYDWENIVRLQRDIVESPTPPGREFSDEEFGKSGNRKLGVNCSYCPFKRACWPGLRTFIYSSGPVFLTKVVREPDVPEVK